MNDIWKRNRDRRRMRQTQSLMRHAENVWRAEIEHLRTENAALREMREMVKTRLRAALGKPVPFEDRWDNA
jgi:FtsZ-binding cell division protein ZapB